MSAKKIYQRLTTRWAVFTRFIKETKSNHQLVKDFLSLGLTKQDRFWLECLHFFLPARLKRLKIYRFIPHRLGGGMLTRSLGIDNKTLYAELYQRMVSNPVIYKEGKLQLKDILLPSAVNDKDVYTLMLVILETLLPYLLEGEKISKDIADSIHYVITEEFSYEFGHVTLNNGDTVIDAGACMGDFAALASVKGCKTYAFEPIPYVIENYLSKTVEWNKNITICEYALSDDEGELEISFTDSLICGSSAHIKHGSDAEKITVQKKTLDTFVHENNLQCVDFIKADIEGGERYMLQGAKNVLRDFAPKLAICTYHLPDDPKVIRDLILDANPNYVIEGGTPKVYAHVPG